MKPSAFEFRPLALSSAEWMAKLESPLALSPADAAVVRHGLEDPRDVARVARMRVLLAAVGKSTLQPLEAFLQLRQAMVVFDASGLLKEARLARCEAAGQLIEAGRPQEALRFLDEALASGVPASDAQQSAEQAKRANALLDLGELMPALDHARQAIDGLNRRSVDGVTRLQLRAWSAGLDVLLAGALAARNFDSALCDMARWPKQVDRFPRLAELQALLEHARQTLKALAPREPEIATLELLLEAMGDPAGAVGKCQALTQRLSASGINGASAWVRLAVAYRLCGRAVLAAHCASEAASTARAAGRTRWQRLALVELALIQHDSGLAAEAGATWLAIRQLDLQVRTELAHGGPAAQVLRGHGADRAAGTGVVRSSATAHVESAMAALKAHPGQAWSVKDLAQHCGVSRRTLEQAFRRELGQTVGEVLRRNRLTLVLQLLELTDHAVKRVAIESGFSSASSLCRELRKHAGVTPAQYRAMKRRR
jgi:AraC-like DNA-binding protein